MVKRDIFGKLFVGINWPCLMLFLAQVHVDNRCMINTVELNFKNEWAKYKFAFIISNEFIQFTNYAHLEKNFLCYNKVVAFIQVQIWGRLEIDFSRME